MSFSSESPSSISSLGRLGRWCKKSSLKGLESSQRFSSSVLVCCDESPRRRTTSSSHRGMASIWTCSKRRVTDNPVPNGVQGEPPVRTRFWKGCVERGVEWSAPGEPPHCRVVQQNAGRQDTIHRIAKSGGDPNASSSGVGRSSELGGVRSVPGAIPGRVCLGDETGPAGWLARGVEGLDPNSPVPRYTTHLRPDHHGSASGS